MKQFFPFSSISVVTQDYLVETLNSQIIVGNAALVKCEIPSFVSDFVKVESWMDEVGQDFFIGIDFGIIPYCFYSYRFLHDQFLRYSSSH